jgi:hypothetical protein
VECPSSSRAGGLGVLFTILIILALVFLYWIAIRDDDSITIARGRFILDDVAYLTGSYGDSGNHDKAMVVLTREARVPRSFTYTLKITLGMVQDECTFLRSNLATCDVSLDRILTNCSNNSQWYRDTMAISISNIYWLLQSCQSW